MKIIQEQCLIGSSTKSGFICGTRKAVCFQDTPLYQLSQNIYSEQEYRTQNSQAKVRYVGAGLMFPKPYIYRRGGRPVIYDNTEEAKNYLPSHELWRVVRLELSDDTNVIDWTHEREWRIPDDFKFEINQATVILPFGFSSLLMPGNPSTATASPNTNAYKNFINLCRSINHIDILSEIRGIVTLNAVFF